MLSHYHIKIYFCKCSINIEVDRTVNQEKITSFFKLDIFNLRNNDVREFKKKVMFLNTILFDHVKT